MLPKGGRLRPFLNPLDPENHVHCDTLSPYTRNRPGLPGISTRTYSGFACVEDEGGTKWVKEQADHGETTYYRYSRVVEWMHSPLGFGAFRMPIRRLGESLLLGWLLRLNALQTVFEAVYVTSQQAATKIFSQASRLFEMGVERFIFIAHEVTESKTRIVD